MPDRSITLNSTIEQWFTNYNLLNGDLLSVTGRVTTAEGNITTLNSSLSTLTGRVTTAESDIDTLDAALVTLTGRVTAAEGVNTSQGSSITTLSGRITTTETDISNLSTRVGSLASLAAGIIAAEADDSIVEAINYVHSLVTGTTAEFTNLVVSGTGSFGGAVTLSSTLAVASGITVAGNTVWHAGNDGAGSTMDADLLDGQQGAYYLAWSNLTGVPSTFTPSAHVHSAADITSGTLAVARGGTGIASYTTGNYVRASAATTLEQRTPAQVLADIGAAAASHTHAATDITSGTLAVARGGTGLASYTTGNYIRASGATALEQRTPAQVLSDIGAAAASHVHAASDITSGTLGVARGGTGLSSLTTGSFIRASGTTSFELRTAVQVLSDIGAAAASHTHATSDITSGTFADARIAQSNVTQYNSVIAPTWANVSGKPSTFTPSTHTHAASDITSGTFDAARIPTLSYLALSGGTLTGDFAITSAAPLITLTENDQLAGAQISRIFRSANVLYIESEGEIRFTGLSGGNISSLTVRSGGINHTIWHAGNDGSGSGLDADLLDGLNSTAFARIDTSNSANFVTTGEVRGSLFRFGSNDEYIQRNGETVEILTDNTVRVQANSSGMNVTGAIVATGDVSGNSDGNLKKDIEIIRHALDRVKEMKGVTFEWNKKAQKRSSNSLRKGKQAGVIYQDVASGLPEATLIGPDGVGSVSVLGMVGLLVQAVKELDAKLEARA